MRATWVEAGNDPDYTKLKRNEIDTAYFDIRDERLSLEYLRGVRAEGIAPGVQADVSWQTWSTGDAFARWASQRLGAIAPDTAPDFPLVCLDFETHDVSTLYQVLTTWRRLRPKRVTDWTLEGMQGGLCSRTMAQLLSAFVRYVCPQAYTGTMVPLDAVAVALDLAGAGFPAKQISLFYPADNLPPAWTGTAFPMGRLP